MVLFEKSAAQFMKSVFKQVRSRSLRSSRPGSTKIEKQESINLTSQQLEEFPEGIFYHAATLKVLRFDYNNIGIIPPRISCLNQLEHLSCKNNRLRQLPDVLGALPKLEVLILARNRLSYLPTILSLNKLKILDLSNNQFSSLPQQIGNLTSLKELSLYVNRLSTLPDSIGYLQNLSFLDASSNTITHLPERIGQCTQLTEVILSSNLLVVFPSELSSLCNLRALDLRCNQIKEIPRHIKELKSLRRLLVADNQISVIHPNIGLLSELTVLNVSSNHLKSLPSSLSYLTELRTLSAGQNQLSSFPSNIGSFLNLKQLDLSHNMIEEIPTAVSSLQNLNRLYVECNRIHTIQKDAFGNLHCLQVIAIHSNRLTIISNELVKLRSIVELDVSCNELDIVSLQNDDYNNPEEESQHLYSLNFGCNSLDSVPEDIFAMPWLVKLNLFGNHIEKLPPKIGTLIALQRIYLSSNLLSELPEEFSLLVQLTEVWLSINPLCSFPEPLLSLVSLEALYMSSSGIFLVPEEISRLQKLKTLVLSSNAIEELPDTLGDLEMLTDLDFSSNRLTKLPSSIAKLWQLRDFDLSNNLLESLPEHWEGMKALHYLKLGNNQLSSIPIGLASLPTLSFLSLTGNPLVDALPDKLAYISDFLENSYRDPYIDDALSIVESCNWSEVTGLRPTQEDVVVVVPQFLELPEASLFCVFDGHAGSEAAEICGANLPSLFASYLLDDIFPPTALENSFAVCHNLVKERGVDSGCTAGIIYINKNRIYSANCGDTRAVLSRNGKAIRLSTDHKPKDTSERHRIALQGGFVSDNGRVMGHLAVSRAIGDCSSAPYISQKPYIYEQLLTKDDEFIVLGCDGLYDVLTDEEVVKIVHSHSPDCSSTVLRDNAYLLGSTDNISVIVIWLNEKYQA